MWNYCGKIIPVLIVFCFTGFTAEKIEINGTKVTTNKSEKIIVYMRKVNAYPEKRIVDHQEAFGKHKITSPNLYEVTEDIIEEDAPIPYHLLNHSVQHVLRKNKPNYEDYYLNQPKFLYNLNRNPIIVSDNKPSVKNRRPKLQPTSENFRSRQENFKSKRKLIEQKNVTAEEDLLQTAESKYTQYIHNPIGRNSYEVTEEPEEIESENYDKNGHIHQNDYNIPNRNYVLIPQQHNLYTPLHDQKQSNPVTLVVLKPVTIEKKVYKPVRVVKVLKPYFIPNNKQAHKPILIKVLKSVENSDDKKYLIDPIRKPILIKVLKPVPNFEENKSQYKNLLSTQISDDEQNYYYREDVQVPVKAKSFQFYNLVNYPENEIKIKYTNFKPAYQNKKNNEEEKYIYYYNQKPKAFIDSDHNVKT